MIRTKVTQTLALAGCTPAGKVSYANGQKRFACGEAWRLIVAVAILSVPAPWFAYGQTHDGTSDPSVAAQSQELPIYTVLYTFTGGTDGAYPTGPLLLDKAGNLYGATSGGGTSGSGVLFKTDPVGAETVLYSFTGLADGGGPTGGLVRDPAGNFYGTTAGGGTFGWGVVFKVDAAGRETVLYTFTGGADGGFPTAGLVRDPAGNLYGTTSAGGDDVGPCVPYGGCGVVFKVDPTGKETVLYTFTGSGDGGFLYAGLLRGPTGNLYGTASGGGASGSGVVFKVDPAGIETVLYTFTGGADGGFSESGLVADPAGNLYGTTQHGGDLSCGFLNSGCGVVFKLDQTGKETVLYTFTGGADGTYPLGGLVRGPAGSLYSTAYLGGADNNGVVFKVDPSGNETVLYTFTGLADGSGPSAGLVGERSGNLYGITGGGGDVSGCNCGVVFKLTPPRADKSGLN